MGRRFAATIVGVVAMAGCGDAGGSGEVETPTEVRVEDPGAEDADRDHLLTACETDAAPGRSDRCEQMIDDAVAGAMDHDCAPRSVEAYVEQALASDLASLPGDEFLERCPLPLSPLMIGVGPEGYTETGPWDPENGLLDSAGLAGLHADPDRWLTYLDQLGHEVSYSRHWQRSGTDSFVIRLDRFSSVESARVHVAPGGDEATTMSSTTIAGVSDATLTETEMPVAGEVPGRHRQVAVGRVCNVAITVFHRGDTPMGQDQMLDWFGDQTDRVGAAITC